MSYFNSSPKNTPNHLILASILLLTSAHCSGDPERPPPSPSLRKEVPKDVPAAISDADSGTEASDPLASAPLPAPAALFGDLGRRRIDEAVDVVPESKGPVILIIVDALNASRLGAYGNKRRTSPFIDGIADRGIVFTNHIANSSWTRPTFASLITGQPKSVHKMEVSCPPIPEEISTLAERFKTAGYATAAFVGNPLVQSRWGFAQGFDTYADAIERNEFQFADDAVLRTEAMRWISAHKHKPFFITIFFTAPHSTYDPPRRFRKFLDALPPGDVLSQPLREYPNGVDEGDLARTLAAYDGEVAYMDAQVGKLLAHLKKLRLRNRTTIAVTADHGEAFDDHHCFKHAYHQWESVLRVPLIIDSPAIRAAGLYEDRPTTHVDLAPSLLGLAGEKAKGLPGLDVSDLLKDPSRNRDRLVASLHNAHGIQRQSVYKGRYKLVHHHQVDPEVLEKINKLHSFHTPTPRPQDLPTLAFDGERYELFDLAADPDETENLFERRKEEAYTVELIAALKDIVEPDEKVTIELNEELREMLMELGYLEDEEKKTSEKR